MLLDDTLSVEPVSLWGTKSGKSLPQKPVASFDRSEKTISLPALVAIVLFSLLLGVVLAVGLMYWMKERV